MPDGDQVQDELAALVLDGVAGIVAALIARNDVVILAQQVHHAALAFVAPVDTGDCSKHSFYLFCSFVRHFSLFRNPRDPAAVVYYNTLPRGFPYPFCP